MRNPSNPEIDINIGAIEQALYDAEYASLDRPLVPTDLIVTHIPGRFVAYVFGGDGRMLLIDTQAVDTEGAN